MSFPPMSGEDGTKSYHGRDTHSDFTCESEFAPTSQLRTQSEFEIRIQSEYETMRKYEFGTKSVKPLPPEGVFESSFRSRFSDTNQDSMRSRIPDSDQMMHFRILALVVIESANSHESNPTLLNSHRIRYESGGISGNMSFHCA